MAHGERWVFDGQTDRQTDRPLWVRILAKPQPG